MSKEWNEAHKEQMRHTSHEWKKRTGYHRSYEKGRAASIKCSYGITAEEYDARLAAQDNICALCKKPFDGPQMGGNGPVLDHDHKTGKLRKFIHRNCNGGLGMFGDDAVTLRLAAEYLEKENGNEKPN